MTQPGESTTLNDQAHDARTSLRNDLYPNIRKLLRLFDSLLGLGFALIKLALWLLFLAMISALIL